jgi:hypothetical protein
MNQPTLPISSLQPASDLKLVHRSTFASQRGIPREAIRPRRFSPQDGRALEILGHAIEYLADEYALECRSPSGFGKPPQVEAIEILMTRSRDIFFSGKPSPTLAEQLRVWLGWARA